MLELEADAIRIGLDSAHASLGVKWMLQGYRVVFVVIAMLIMSTLACNLTRSDEPEDSTQLINTTAAPTLQLISAPSIAVVNQPIVVEIEASVSSGSVTRVELQVNGLSVAQQSGTGANPFRTTLSWTPLRPGSIQISVVAYQGINASTPQTISVSVGNATGNSSDNDNNGSGGGIDTSFTPSAPNQGPCSAQMTTSLRLRSEPSTVGGADTIIYVFNIGDIAPILGRLADDSWYQVQSPATGQTGWVFYNSNDGQYFTQTGRCVDVPIISSPATATPVPTTVPTPTTAPPVAATPPDIVAVPITGNTSLQLNEGTAVGNYSLQVQNAGGSDTGAFDVLIVLPGGQQVTRQVANLSPGQVLNLADGGGQQQAVTFTTAGQRSISILADFEGVVTESNEGNNFQIIDIIINE